MSSELLVDCQRSRLYCEGGHRSRAGFGLDIGGGCDAAHRQPGRFDPDLIYIRRFLSFSRYCLFGFADTFWTVYGSHHAPLAVVNAYLNISTSPRAFGVRYYIDLALNVSLQVCCFGLHSWMGRLLQVTWSKLLWIVYGTFEYSFFFFFIRFSFWFALIVLIL